MRFAKTPEESLERLLRRADSAVMAAKPYKAARLYRKAYYKAEAIGQAEHLAGIAWWASSMYEAAEPHRTVGAVRRMLSDIQPVYPFVMYIPPHIYEQDALMRNTRYARLVEREECLRGAGHFAYLADDAYMELKMDRALRDVVAEKEALGRALRRR